MLKRAALLGVILGATSIVLVYAITELMPPPSPGGLIVLFTMLGTAIAFQWRTWFSGDPSAGALKRLGRALALTAGAVPISGATAFVIVLMWSGYPAWDDGAHRARLVARGVPAAEIEAAVAQHHHEPVNYLGEGATAAALTSTMAALATTAVGAVVLRSRPRRP